VAGFRAVNRQQNFYRPSHRFTRRLIAQRPPARLKGNARIAPKSWPGNTKSYCGGKNYEIRRGKIRKATWRQADFWVNLPSGKFSRIIHAAADISSKKLVRLGQKEAKTP
jgi:hypothetical protein